MSFNFIQPRLVLYCFLIFCVASSKHFIIYNEEILVALCFFGFIFFIQKWYSEPLVEFIDEKGEITAQEYEASVQASARELSFNREQYLIMKELGSGVSLIREKTIEEFSLFTESQQKAILKRENDLKINDTFKKLISLRKGYSKLLQEKIADEFLLYAKKRLSTLASSSSKNEEKRKLLTTLKKSHLSL